MAQKNFFLTETDRINPLWNFGIISGDTEQCTWMENTFHWHDYFEIEIIYDGKSEHILNNKSYITSRGDVYLLKYFDFHTHRYIDNKFSYFYNFNFNDMALPEEIINIIINSKGNIYCHFEEDEFAKLLEDIEFLFKENENPNKDPIHISLMQVVFTKIVLTILRKCNIEISTPIEEGCIPFNRAIALTQCHFRDSLSLNSLADRVGVTPNYLGQLFKRNLGVTFSTYLKNTRLKYSKNLLHHSNYSIEQISHLSGFSTSSHFIDCFKQKYGITPKQYILNNMHKELQNS